MTSVHGILILDKPAGMTSHDVVDRVRRIFGTRKVGHLGTLDPAATGVLPVVLGKATRLSRFFPTHPREYTGEIRLGWETTTDDAEGTPLERHRVDVTEDQAVEAMRRLTGRIEQTPPPYSAKKIAGVRAYDMARRGRAPELKSIVIEVEAFELVSFTSPVIAFRVVCSAGTYVRSLARDLGRILGTGAHLSSLRRIQAGIFRIAQAVDPARASTGDLIRAEETLADLPSIRVDPPEAARIANGGPIPCQVEASPLCIFNKNGELIAIGSAEKGWAHPQVVLI